MNKNPIYVVCPACAKICTKGRSFARHVAKKGTDCAQFIIQEKIPEAHYTIGHPDQCFHPGPTESAESMVGNLDSTLDNETEEYSPQLPDYSSGDNDSIPASGSSNSHHKGSGDSEDLPPSLQPLSLHDPLDNNRLKFIINWLQALQDIKTFTESSDTNVRGYDTSLLQMAVRNTAMRPIQQQSVPPNLAAEIALLHEIQKTNGACPGYMFDTIVNWAKKWITPDLTTSLYTEFRTKSVVTPLVEEYAFAKDMKPRKKRIILPNVECPLDVTVFPFVPTLYDLLTNPLLDQDENYLFNGNNPLESPN